MEDSSFASLEDSLLFRCHESIEELRHKVECAVSELEATMEANKLEEKLAEAEVDCLQDLLEAARKERDEAVQQFTRLKRCLDLLLCKLKLVPPSPMILQTAADPESKIGSGHSHGHSTTSSKSAGSKNILTKHLQSTEPSRGLQRQSSVISTAASPCQSHYYSGGTENSKKKKKKNMTMMLAARSPCPGSTNMYNNSITTTSAPSFGGSCSVITSCENELEAGKGMLLVGNKNSSSSLESSSSMSPMVQLASHPSSSSNSLVSLPPASVIIIGERQPSIRFMPMLPESASSSNKSMASSLMVAAASSSHPLSSALLPPSPPPQQHCTTIHGSTTSISPHTKHEEEEEEEEEDGKMVVDSLVTSLPEKGKLLEAVAKAGPLLQQLFIIGQLPEWNIPPPMMEMSLLPSIVI